MVRREADDRVKPHMKLCLHQLKKKLRLELHRKYLGTWLKIPKKDFWEILFSVLSEFLLTSRYMFLSKFHRLKVKQVS